MNENAESVKERPILFSGPMVRAILNGQKHVTRRPIVALRNNGNPALRGGMITDLSFDVYSRLWLFRDARKHWNDLPDILPHCPFGAPGDRLWVRETFYPIWREDHTLTALYRADGITLGTDDTGKQLHWKPAIHMPRAASRLTLEITGINVERVQDITEDEAWDEGIGEIAARQTWISRTAFATLWDNIYAARGLGWADNPWVWVAKFRPLEEA